MSYASHSKAIKIERLISDITGENREWGGIADADTIERMPLTCLIACLYYMKAKEMAGVDGVIGLFMEKYFSLCNLTMEEIECNINKGADGLQTIDDMIALIKGCIRKQ